MKLLLIWTGVLSYLYLFCDCGKRNNYNFEILSVYCTTTNEILVNISCKLETGSFGVQKLSAFFVWNFDEDENTMAGMAISHGQSGRDEDYHPLPYKIPQIQFYDFLNQYYMKVIYPDFGPCSNLPAIDPPFVPPWEKKTYIFKNCLPSGEAYPDFMASGYYKFQFSLIAEVQVGVTVTLKLSPKLV